MSVLILEPFYGGSHKQLIDTITTFLNHKGIEFDLITLSAKKWHWKARTAAIELLTRIDPAKPYKTLFCSSVLNLCELVGLCPWLMKCKKVVYFHENQLEYPVQNEQERDFQYGYNQILTALTADIAIFNSKYNMDSFLSKIHCTLKKIPGFKPKNFAERIIPKCQVLYFPLQLPNVHEFSPNTFVNKSDTLRILWAHRWEHDKNPVQFFNVLFQLKQDEYQFQVSVLGEQFKEVSPIFEEARDKLGADFINHWGFIENKKSYYHELASCDVTVSTALHEFFGVSVVEAVHLGCFPLCPNRLVYPEIFPPNCLYNTQQQLYKRLKNYCKNKSLAKLHYDKTDFRLDRFDWKILEKQYLSVLTN